MTSKWFCACEAVGIPLVVHAFGAVCSVSWWLLRPFWSVRNGNGCAPRSPLPLASPNPSAHRVAHHNSGGRDDGRLCEYCLRIRELRQQDEEYAAMLRASSGAALHDKPWICAWGSAGSLGTEYLKVPCWPS
jgi:hypothetical protein